MKRLLKRKIFNYYVISANFDGHGKGFALGFDSYCAARYFAAFVLFGFADVLPDYLLECRFPHYYHSLISKTY